MRIVMYNNLSDKNHIDKNLTYVGDFEGTLREETSIVDPIITINMEHYRKANYFYIPEFSRYYFVTNVTSVRTGLWRFELHCDVLSSFASPLRELPAVVVRQENNWNLYLNDPMFAVDQRPRISTIPFPKTPFNAPSYILTLVGGEGSGSKPPKQA